MMHGRKTSNYAVSHLFMGLKCLIT